MVVDVRRTYGLSLFQGVGAIKWAYTVMPFGPTNGPATFINFIHDIDSVWKELAKSHGITIDEDTNTRIIVDDIVNWADSFQRSLLYMRCQLIVCRAYRLSLNLGKSHFFPPSFRIRWYRCLPRGQLPCEVKTPAA